MFSYSNMRTGFAVVCESEKPGVTTLWVLPVDSAQDAADVCAQLRTLSAIGADLSSAEAGRLALATVGVAV